MEYLWTEQKVLEPFAVVARYWVTRGPAPAETLAHFGEGDWGNRGGDADIEYIGEMPPPVDLEELARSIFERGMVDGGEPTVTHRGVYLEE